MSREEFRPARGESLRDFSRRLWEELPEEIRARCVYHLRRELHPDSLVEWRGEIKDDPEGWVAKHHFMGGMTFRNLLRDVAKDDELPSGNWDDYYSAAVEEAVLP